MRKLLFSRFGFAAVACTATLAAGCSSHAPRQNVQGRVSAPAPAPIAPPAENTAAPSAPKMGVIYTVGDTGGDDNNLVAHPVSLSHGQSPARAALRALIDADHSPIPEGTILRHVRIADGLATVDFSREFQSHFHGSETEEAQTVNSVLRTLGQFPSIERVQFLVEGKPVDALSQLPLSGPLDVIRPDPARAASVAGGAAHG